VIQTYLQDIKQKQIYETTLFDNYKLTKALDLEDFDVKQIPKTEEETRQYILLEVKQAFPKVEDSVVLRIAKNYVLDSKFLQKLWFLKTYITHNKQQLQQLLEQIVLENPNTIFNDNTKIYVLNIMIKYSPQKLKTTYDKQTLVECNSKYSFNKFSFTDFLKQCGYSQNGGSMKINTEIYNILQHILQKEINGK
jgi:hypothetical protein